MQAKKDVQLYEAEGKAVRIDPSARLPNVKCIHELQVWIDIELQGRACSIEGAERFEDCFILWFGDGTDLACRFLFLQGV